MTSFDTIWSRIKANEGSIFQQMRGKEFTYTVVGAAVIPSSANQNIPRSHFEQAYRLLPLESTVPLQHLRGPSYLYAILMDTRIQNGD